MCKAAAGERLCRQQLFVVVKYDFGIGIPPGQQSQLFNRFFRASEAKSNTFRGLGLGLYISNEIVKRHSGVLDLLVKKGKDLPFILNCQWRQCKGRYFLEMNSQLPVKIFFIQFPHLAWFQIAQRNIAYR